MSSASSSASCLAARMVAITLRLRSKGRQDKAGRHCCQPCKDATLTKAAGGRARGRWCVPLAARFRRNPAASTTAAATTAATTTAATTTAVTNTVRPAPISGFDFTFC
jgi:hypothetical protein